MNPNVSTRTRSLIVTADDYGAAGCIDRAIDKASATGQISAISVLTNYPRSDIAIREFRQRFPDIGIGIHLNITSGPPRTDCTKLGNICNAKGFFLGLASLMDKLGTVNRAALEYELRAQIEALVALGIDPDHLSSHHNILAIYPPFQDIMIRLAQEYRVPIRTPVAISQTHTRRFGYAKTRRRAVHNIAVFAGRRPHRAIRLLPGTYIRLRRSKKILQKKGVLTPSHLIDSLYGQATIRNLRHILRHLPVGVSELVVHLGDCSGPQELPEGIETEILTERTIERNLILNGTLRQMLLREGIAIAGYRDLAGMLATE